MLELGKYGFVVLASYGVTLVLIGGLILQSVRARRRVRAKLRAIEEK